MTDDDFQFRIDGLNVIVLGVDPDDDRRVRVWMAGSCYSVKPAVLEPTPVRP
jgi:hypothetical protein